MTLQKFDAPVIIVGAGPVGMSAAGDLAWRGVPCIVIEQSDGSIYQPKMDLVGVRTMEFCRRWGIAEWVRNSPYPRDFRQDFAYCTSVTGFEMCRAELPTLNESRPPEYSPQTRERCPQNMFDPILRRFCESFDHVDMTYEAKFLDFQQDDEGVTVEFEKDGERRILRSRYLIGCDGVGSTVRKNLGIKMEGRPVLTYATNIMFKCPELRVKSKKGEVYRYILVGEEGVWATLVAIDGYDTYRLQIVGNENPVDETEESTRAIIERALGTHIDYELLSVVPWTRRELVAEHYGRGRVWLAGDSVHAMSPTGGFGMNAGISDAVDLSWKIWAELSGWGGPALLESYELERRPIGQRTVKQAANNVGHMRAYRPNCDLTSDGPDAVKARAEAGRRLHDVMAREWFSPGIHVGYRYDHSPVIADEGDPVPPMPVNEYNQSGRPGSRAPHVWLDENRSTLDYFGKDFVLLILGEIPTQAKRLTTAFHNARVPFTEIRLRQPEVHETYGGKLVIVRPDGHIAWRGDTDPPHADALIHMLMGFPDTNTKQTRGVVAHA